MRSYFIISSNTLDNYFFCGFKTKLSAIEIELRFNDPINSLRQCIFIRVPIFCHTNCYSTANKQRNISCTAVLRTSVRVMGEGLFAIEAVAIAISMTENGDPYENALAER